MIHIQSSTFTMFFQFSFILLTYVHMYRKYSYFNLSFTKGYCREIPSYLGIVTPLTVICLVSTFSNVGRWGRVAPKFFRSTSALPGLGLSSQAGRTYSNNPCNKYSHYSDFYNFVTPRYMYINTWTSCDKLPSTKYSMILSLIQKLKK